MSSELIKNPLDARELGTTLLVTLGGALLALALSRRSLFAAAGAPHSDGAVRRVTMVLGVALEQFDAWVRRWTSAGLLMLLLAGLFVGLMRVGQAA